jgi:hypothetical protein
MGRAFGRYGREMHAEFWWRNLKLLGRIKCGRSFNMDLKYVIWKEVE